MRHGSQQEGAVAGIAFAAQDDPVCLDTQRNAVPSYTEPVREATVFHSIDGSFAITRGNWKLLLAPGSGGWSYPRPGRDPVDGLPPMQLYDLTADIGETTNLYATRPDIVADLTDLLRKYIRDGRSTPGTPQSNDGAFPWEEIRGWF